MKKLASYILIGLVFLSIGIWFGYEKALNNQIYFDSPAKIALYNAVLEKESSKEFLEGAIIQELGLMEYMKDKTTPLLLNHPAHSGMKEAYEKFYVDMENLPQVIKAQQFIKTYNKARNEMDGSDEPPIR